MVYKVGVLLFTLLTLGTGLCGVGGGEGEGENVTGKGWSEEERKRRWAGVLVCRFFAGFFGGPVLAVGAGKYGSVLPS